MPRVPQTRSAALLTPLIVIVAALMVGCGHSSDPPPEEHASLAALVIAEALGSVEAERELERREETREGGAEFPQFGFRNESARRTAIQRMRDRAIDERFRKTPFDKAIDQLPLREPPLRVVQWVTTDRSPTLDTRTERERFYRLSEREQARWLIPRPEHKLYARVNQDQFYAMPERERASAVRAFYRDARKAFEDKGIRDFVLVVTPLTETLEQLPALAVGRDGSASLTLLGRVRPGRGV